jgi:hypothetical protein
MISRIAGVCALAGLLQCACSQSSSESSSYQIWMWVHGTEADFQNRTVDIGGYRAPSAGISFLTGSQTMATYVAFCTESLDVFLNTPVEIKVSEGDVVLWEGSVTRYGCLYTKEEERGYEEDSGVFLNSDGTIANDIGTDPGTYSACSTPGYKLLPCGEESNMLPGDTRSH